MHKGRLHAGLFCFGERRGERVSTAFGGREKNFALHATFRHDPILWFRPAGGTTNMRAFALGLIISAAVSPCLAQTVLKSEPLILAPYEIAFVQDPSCGAGKVRKVTGAIRGLQRRKACVTLAAEQASLASATP
ncbi:hypothetical protein [Bradyrhizobium jicamae]|nr:hypothetical protein [Bradyrhizobium jicamae]